MNLEANFGGWRAKFRPESALCTAWVYRTLPLWEALEANSAKSSGIQAKDIENRAGGG